MRTGTVRAAGVIALLMLSATAMERVEGATWRVGAGGDVDTIARAAELARDDDTVLIMPGTYEGDVAVWKQRGLTIRGLDPRPVLLADGKYADGKAIWVFSNGNFLVENIAFRGARVPDGNGAGIRFEQGTLEVRNCSFEDNEIGLLTGNFPAASLTIRDSSFARAPHTEGSLPHLLYVGRIDRFVLEGSRFRGGYRGHLVKSRARRSELRYNLIFDGPGGRASYEVDLPDGGDALLVGNVIGQSSTSDNPVVVAYGAEGGNWPVNRLAMAHNTLLGDGWRPAWFVRSWSERLVSKPEVLTRNNLTVGLGAFELGLDGDHAGNRILLPGALDVESLDFRLPEDSWVTGSAAMPSAPELMPHAEFRRPAGTQPIGTLRHWSPGAYQSVRPASRAVGATASAAPASAR